MTERLHFDFSLPCTGEGNGNPLQCSSLENPRDGGAWWAAVYGVAQSRTRLKQLSSSNSSSRTSLVVQWLRVCLPMQGIWVWFMVQEDTTCPRATKAVHLSCGVCAPEPGAAAAEPTCSAQSPSSAIREWPLLTATRESLNTAMKTQ